MPLRVHIDLGYQPDFGEDQLLEIVQAGLGDRYKVHGSGRFQVWDVMVEQSAEVGAAIQIVQGRLRKRTRLRVYGLAPSVARRGSTPLGLQRQDQQTRPLVDEVVRFLEQSDRLRSG